MIEEQRGESFEDLPLLGELRERLRERFLAAEAPAVEPRHSRRWSARHSRPLLVLGALLLAAGTATAAVTLTATPSAPLAGSVPGHAEAPRRGLALTESGKRYRIVFAPQLSGGEAGWRTFIAFGPNGALESAAGGDDGYPTRTAPLAGGAGVGFSSSPLPGGEVVDYVLTAPRVAAVRLGERTIRTRSSPALPGGDRAAVFFLPADSPPITIPSRGAHPGRGGFYYVRVPALPAPSRIREALRALRARERAGARGVGRGLHVLRGRARAGATRPPTHLLYHRRTVLIRATPLFALDQDRHPIPYTPPGAHGARRRVSAWQLGPAGRHPGAAASHPLPGACEIAQSGLPGLQPEWGHVLSAIGPVPGAEGELFLSCVDTEYFLHGWPLDSAVLLDAYEPGRALGPIPGADPVPGHPGVVNVVLGALPGDLTARRVGNAWLAVQGGASLAQRLRVLGALRISKLELPRR